MENGTMKITTAQLLAAKRWHQYDEPISVIAQRLGVSKMTMARYLRNSDKLLSNTDG